MVPAEAVHRFRADLEKILGFAPEAVGVAISGGPDSLALLLLARTAYPGVTAATVDHGLRPESKEEARFVAAICQELGVPHAVLAPDWEQPPSANIQAAAREARYAALCRWAPGGMFLTAHHRDDQAETLLLRLARGAGLSGLSGIREMTYYVSGSQGGTIVRPLLGWRRSELGEIVFDAGLSGIDDPSNSADRYDRTQARRLLAEVPWLDPERLAASAKHLCQAEDAVTWAEERVWEARARTGEDGSVGIDPHGLPRELQRRLLLRALWHFTDDAAIPGPKLIRLLDGLLNGEPGTIAGVQARPGPEWRLSFAPPRRDTSR